MVGMAPPKQAPAPGGSSKIKTALAAAFCGSALLACALGVRAAMRSPLFLIQIVEVSGADEPDIPLDAEEISRLARIPVGTQNLFELDLAAVERRVLEHPWVREVRLQKRFPQTVAVVVTAREPRAILQRSDGTLAYLDTDGQGFGRVDLSVRPDLPVISGLDAVADRQKIFEALELALAWGRGALDELAPVSSVDYHPERGFRAWVSYGLGNVNFSTVTRKARTSVELGLGVERIELEARLARLQGVFGYLSLHSIPAQQIRAEPGKKIVVKIARGS